MSATGKVTTIVVIAGAVCVGGWLAWRTWLSEHDARVRTEAQLAESAKRLDDAAARQKQRDAQVADALDQLTALKKRTQTPQQVVKALPQVLPLPQPIEIVPETGTAPAAPGELPEQPVAQMPVENLKPLFDFATDCQSCKIERDTLKANFMDEQKKEQVLTEQRDAALKLAKGGGFWRRAARAAKWFAIGAAVGATAAAVAHH